MPSTTLLLGDCADQMRTLADNSIDSICTDPPYALVGTSGTGGFMGAKWDSELPTVEMWKEALRVAKPGAHLLAFGGTRTYHRLACAIEDAGWEVRDCIMWVYGSGFPKSMDVAKAIDKASGYEGEVIGSRIVDVGMQGGNMHAGRKQQQQQQQIRALSPEAAAWQGWGTQTKPAYEPVVIAVKPYDGDVGKAINHLKSMEEKLCSLNVKDAEKNLRPFQAVSSGVKADSALASAPTPQEEEKERLTTTGKVDAITLKAATSALAQGMESIVLNTISLWRRTLEDAYALTNKSTTSMESSLTTDLKTWSCFLLQTTLEDIADLVTQQSKLNASALLAENYFYAVSAKLNTIRTLTVAGNVISQNEITPHLSPIVVARKPLEGTVAANVLKYGTGAINIDACRVPTFSAGPGTTPKSSVEGRRNAMAGAMDRVEYDTSKGRFPANLIHDGSPEVVSLFPDSKGQCGAVKGTEPSRTGSNGIYGVYSGARPPHAPRNDSGSAARFFKCCRDGEPSADRRYTDNGSTNFAMKPGMRRPPEDSPARFFYCAKASRSERGSFNDHCTVKPLALMRYLVRLVTPPAGIVLDPFMGSGTTGVAALQEGFSFVGIERDPHYYDIAKSRVLGPIPPVDSPKAKPKTPHTLSAPVPVQEELF